MPILFLFTSCSGKTFKAKFFQYIVGFWENIASMTNGWIFFWGGNQSTPEKPSESKRNDGQIILFWEKFKTNCMQLFI